MNLERGAGDEADVLHRPDKWISINLNSLRVRDGTNVIIGRALVITTIWYMNAANVDITMDSAVACNEVADSQMLALVNRLAIPRPRNLWQR